MKTIADSGSTEFGRLRETGATPRKREDAQRASSRFLSIVMWQSSSDPFDEQDREDDRFALRAWRWCREAKPCSELA